MIDGLVTKVGTGYLSTNANIASLAVNEQCDNRWVIGIVPIEERKIRGINIRTFQSATSHDEISLLIRRSNEVIL